MHPHERRERLVTLLAKHGFTSVAQLADHLGVSQMTVRRDLHALHAAGLVKQVQGGGEVAHTAQEPAFMAKRLLQQTEKLAIARRAIELIEPGMSIGLSAGTTTWAIAQLIRGFADLTFVTNSTNVAIELRKNGWQNIILSGGNFRTPSDALVGPFAEATVRALHTDLLFLGVHGISMRHGLSTPNVLEAAVDRLLIKQANRAVVVFDHTKWGVEALAHIADIAEIDVFVTDDGDGAQQVGALRRQGADVIVVPASGARGALA